MKQTDARKYIKKIGLEKSVNGIMRAPGEAYFDNETDLIKFSIQTVSNYIKKFGKDYRITMYILRMDETVQLCFNDEEGINMTQKESLAFAQEYAERFSQDEFYILLVETKENWFSLVSRK